MSDVVIIILAILAVIVFFILLGLIFFLLGITYEKKLPKYIDEVNELNDRRTEVIKKDIEIINSKKGLQKFNFEQFDLTEEDTLSTMRDKQDVSLILVKKIIDESNVIDDELEKIKNEAEELSSTSEEIFDRYNRKISVYNTFIRFIFARPFAYLAKKTTYPYIH